MTRPSPFLTAEWRNLVMLNYEVDPKLLETYAKLGIPLKEQLILAGVEGAEDPLGAAALPLSRRRRA